MRGLELDADVQPIRNLAPGPQGKDGPAAFWFQFNPGNDGVITTTYRTDEPRPYKRATFTTAPTAGNPGWYTNGMVVALGVPHTQSFWIRSSKAGTYQVYGRVWGQGDSAIQTVTLEANVWTRVSATVTPTLPGNTGISLLCRAAAATDVGSGVTVDVRDSLVTAGSTLAHYADGDTPGWRWTGPANNSASVGYPYRLETIAGRPAAWYDARYPLGRGVALPADGTPLDRWVDLSGRGRDLVQATATKRPAWRSSNPNLLTYAVATIDYADTAAATLPPGWSVYGTSVVAQVSGGKLRLAPPVGATGYLGAASPSFGGIVPGQSYTFEATATRVAGTTGGTGVRIEWRDSAGTYLSGSILHAATGRVSVTATAPASATRATVVVYLPSYTAGSDVFDFDFLGFYAGSLPAAWIVPATLPGGNPVARFDGVDDVLSVAYPKRVVDPVTFYAVAAVRGATSKSESIAEWEQATRLRRLSNTEWGIDFLNTDSAGKSWSAGKAFPVGSPFLISATRDTVVRAAVNGSEGWTSTATGSTFTNQTVRANLNVGVRDSAAFADMDLAALILFDAFHDQTTRRRVEAWLASIYGITLTA